MNESFPSALTSPFPQEEADHLQSLYEVNDTLKQVVADGLEIDEVLPRVLGLAMNELNAGGGSIVVLDEQGKPQHAWIMTEDEPLEEDLPFFERALSGGLIGWVTEEQRTLRVADTRNDSRWLPRPGHITSEESWTAVCSPLLVRSRAVGAITMTRPGQDQFTDDEIAFLDALANQAAATIESARLYEESQRRAGELGQLVAAATAITATLHVDEVLETVANQMCELAQAQGCMIYDVDRESSGLTHRILIVPQAARENLMVEDVPHRLRRALEELGTQILEPRQIANSSDLSRAERAVLELTGARYVLLVPLRVRGHSVGVVTLFNLTVERRFEEEVINLTHTLASHAAMALENAHLYEASQRQVKVGALLNEASRVLNSTLDTTEILQSLLGQMNELLHAEAISIALVDEQRNELVYEVAAGIGSKEIVGLRLPSNRGISGWVMEHGVPALVPDTAVDERFNLQGDRRTGHSTRAMICAPLQVKGEVLGTVQAINPLKGTFTAADLQLLDNLGNLAGSALHNAQQFARTQAAEARYMRLFEDSVSPILLTNSEGYIVEANRRAEVFFAYAKDELRGTPLQQIHAAEPPEPLPDFEAIEHDAVTSFNSLIQQQEGRTVPVEVYAKRTSSGETELLQWIYRDITHQVELEEMREDLTAMLVHDLQSPLANVISGLEMLRYELPPDSDPLLRSIMEIVARSSQRLRTLIRSLLDITRLEAGHPIADAGYHDVRALIADAREVVEPSMARREAELLVEMPDELPPFYGDDDMIRRVFVNLLDNASKYTPEGGEVTVRIRQTENGEMLQVSVSDQGVGIPPQYREQVFKKFRRVQKEGGPKGMGLGLAFCRLAVEAHGGDIWIDDAPDGGARFNLTLPTTPAGLHTEHR